MQQAKLNKGQEKEKRETQGEPRKEIKSQDQATRPGEQE